MFTGSEERDQVNEDNTQDHSPNHPSSNPKATSLGGVILPTRRLLSKYILGARTPTQGIKQLHGLFDSGRDASTLSDANDMSRNLHGQDLQMAVILILLNTSLKYVGSTAFSYIFDLVGAR